MSHTYTCEYCQTTFDHPDAEDCATFDGRCVYLMGAGWRPVWLRAYVELDPSAVRRRRVGQRRPRTDRHLFTRGGWVCNTCAYMFLPMFRRRPKERNLTRSAHQEGRTR